MAVIDELLIGLGFEYDPSEMQQFRRDIDQTTNAIKSLAKIAAVGAAAITGIVVTSTAASDELGKMADEVNTTTEDLDGLSFALSRSGGEANQMGKSLRDLSIRFVEASRGEGSALKAFKQLGIRFNDINGDMKTTGDLFIEISEKIKDFSRAEQIEFADKFGLRDSIRLIQQGPEAIREMIAEAEALGVVTAEDSKIAASFQDSLTDLFKIIAQIGRIITREFAPILEDTNRAFIEWWKNNKLLIETEFPKWVETASKAMKLLLLATGAWIASRLLFHIQAAVILFRALTVSVLLANAAILLLPILITGAIASLVLLAEDAKIFFEGGESFIGDMIEKFPKWKTELEVIAKIFKTMADLVELIFKGWSNLFYLFDNFSIDKMNEVLGNLPGFIGFGLEQGVDSIIGEGTVESVRAADAKATRYVIDKIDIVVQGGIDTAETIAESVMNVFQSSTEELSSGVDQ